MILLSACLAGVRCKYSGGNNEVPELKKLYEEGRAVLVCPEVMGGLPTPRIPCEIRDGRVYNKNNEDKTENYITGARKALAVCLENNCTLAILKANSPSCGPDQIYDGTFTHTKIEGSGIFARMLKEHGIKCISETDDLKGLEEYI